MCIYIYIYIYIYIPLEPDKQNGISYFVPRCPTCRVPGLRVLSTESQVPGPIFPVCLVRIVRKLRIVDSLTSLIHVRLCCMYHCFLPATASVVPNIF